MVTAAIEGNLEHVTYELDPIFNVYVPTTCPGVPSNILKPRNTWTDGDAYDKQARQLAQLFVDNFSKFLEDMPKEIGEAGPRE